MDTSSRLDRNRVSRSDPVRISSSGQGRLASNSHTDFGRASPWLRPPLALACVLILSACSPDLRETVGPLVPFPNVSGRVMRDGQPLIDRKVKLEVADQDSLVDEDRTDSQGRYGFSGVSMGRWELRVESADSVDFARVSYEFAFDRADTMLEAPSLDVSLGGFAPDSPKADDTLDTPSFSSPMTFEWRLPEGFQSRVQVRVYQAGGQAVWFSSKTRDPSLRWNGLANQGPESGRPISSGPYRYRLVIEDSDALRRYTAYHAITFE